MGLDAASLPAAGQDPTITTMHAVGIDLTSSPNDLTKCRLFEAAHMGCTLAAAGICE